MNFMMEYEKLLNLPKQTIDKNKSFITKLKKKKKANHIDTIFQEKHEEVFEVIDCLKCGNCCKTTSPVFRDVDIKRISKKQKIKSLKFIETYLRTDSDGDYVLKSSPCAFLNKVDNSCTIYHYRPLACESYPHTNRKNMYQILDLTLKNTEVCPAAAKIITELQKENNMDKPGPRTNN
tara:strand:- start:180 stop:713 length:534 start_codon:yes stop_codon:yes gene_type:complete